MNINSLNDVVERIKFWRKMKTGDVPCWYGTFKGEISAKSYNIWSDKVKYNIIGWTSPSELLIISRHNFMSLYREGWKDINPLTNRVFLL